MAGSSAESHHFIKMLRQSVTGPSYAVLEASATLQMQDLSPKHAANLTIPNPCSAKSRACKHIYAVDSNRALEDFHIPLLCTCCINDCGAEL